MKPKVKTFSETHKRGARYIPTPIDEKVNMFIETSVEQLIDIKVSTVILNNANHGNGYSSDTEYKLIYTVIYIPSNNG